jgi:hypothetical protein
MNTQDLINATVIILTIFVIALGALNLYQGNIIGKHIAKIDYLESTVDKLERKLSY